MALQGVIMIGIVIKAVHKQGHVIPALQKGLYRAFFNGLIRNKGRAGFSKEEIISKWSSTKRDRL